MDNIEKEIIEQEILDYLIQNYGETVFNYLTLKKLQKQINLAKEKDKKLIDFQTNKEYRELLDEFFSEAENAIFFCDFEQDLKRIWNNEDMQSLKFYVAYNVLNSLDEMDAIVSNNDELHNEIEILKQKRKQYDRAAAPNMPFSNWLIELFELLKKYNKISFKNYAEEIKAYKGNNTACLIIIEKLKKLGFLDDDFSEIFESGKQQTK